MDTVRKIKYFGCDSRSYVIGNMQPQIKKLILQPVQKFSEKLNTMSRLQLRILTLVLTDFAQ